MTTKRLKSLIVINSHWEPSLPNAPGKAKEGNKGHRCGEEGGDAELSTGERLTKRDLRRCYTRQFLLQLVSQFCCDTSCALRYRLLESCYTGQRFSVILEAVVSSAAILSWNKTSRAQKEQFDWPMPLNIATQVAGKVLHCATCEKFLATLRNALRKVELTSNFRNDCGNKKMRQIYVAGYVTLGNISCNLCRNKIARQVAREIA